MDGSWWRVLTKSGPLEKGMENHFSIFALITHEQYGNFLHWQSNNGDYLAECCVKWDYIYKLLSIRQPTGNVWSMVDFINMFPWLGLGSFWLMVNCINWWMMGKWVSASSNLFLSLPGTKELGYFCELSQFSSFHVSESLKLLWGPVGWIRTPLKVFSC